MAHGYFIIFNNLRRFSLKEIYGYFVPAEMLGDAMKWGPLRYAPAFFLGMLAYVLRPWFLKTFNSQLLNLSLAILIVGALTELIFLQIGNEFLNTLLLTAGIIMIGGTGGISSILFERKSIIFLGTISYSLYITHMFVLTFLPEMLDTMPFAKFIATAFFNNHNKHPNLFVY